MDLSKLLDDYPEVEEELNSLSPEAATRFRRLFAKRRQKLLVPVLISAGLGVYCFAAGLWLDPGYSWIFALLPTLFLTVFARSQIAGVISEKGQASKFYGLLTLPLVFAALCTLCGALTNAYFDITVDRNDSGHYQQVVEDCRTETESDEDRCKDAAADLRDAERRQEEDKPELLRGIIMSGVAIAAIYPASIYYLNSVVRKNNLLVTKELLGQVKAKKKNK